MTLEANAFFTYPVNTIRLSRLKDMEVLLDNQADISIIKPGLVQNLGTAKQEVRVSGIGAMQLTVKDSGYL
jgi:hypothetical protein